MREIEKWGRKDEKKNGKFESNPVRLPFGSGPGARDSGQPGRSIGASAHQLDSLWPSVDPQCNGWQRLTGGAVRNETFGFKELNGISCEDRR